MTLRRQTGTEVPDGERGNLAKGSSNMATQKMCAGCRGILAALICSALVVTAAFGQAPTESLAGGPASLPSVQVAAPAPAGLSDTLQPQAADAVVAPPQSARTCDAAQSAAAALLSLSEKLRAWDDNTRHNAELQVELPRAVPPEIAALAREIEAAWSSGQYDAAIALLDWLEACGTPVALGVGWHTARPVDGAALTFVDARIGARTGGSLTKLDYDRPSGKLFAVVNWPADGWALYQSTNDGQSWSETYFWSSGTASVVDVDMAVVGDFVYVGYVYSGNANEARLRRNFVADGAPDMDYFYRVILNASPATVEEVAVESNADAFADRIYIAARQSDHAVRWAWDESADGLSFTEYSPDGASARGGLDMHWNTNFTNWFLFLSYVGTDNQIHVLRRSEATWGDIVVDSAFTGTHDRTAVSAWGNTVICGYERAYTDGQGIRYRISYDAGNAWSTGELAVPGPGEGNYQMVDITARGGAGTAAMYTHEVGEPDDVLIRYRRGYASGPWHAPMRVNTFDVTTGSWTMLNWTPRDTSNSEELSYGLIYLSSGIPYFVRFQRLPGDLNCDGVVNFGDINPFVLAPPDETAEARRIRAQSAGDGWRMRLRSDADERRGDRFGHVGTRGGR